MNCLPLILQKNEKDRKAGAAATMHFVVETAKMVDSFKKTSLSLIIGKLIEFGIATSQIVNKSSTYLPRTLPTDQVICYSSLRPYRCTPI